MNTTPVSPVTTCPTLDELTDPPFVDLVADKVRTLAAVGPALVRLLECELELDNQHEAQGRTNRTLKRTGKRKHPLNTSKHVGAVCALVVALSPVAAYGQCPFESFSQAKERSVMTFSGVATNITPLFIGQIMTFAVDAVWHGMVHKQVVAYQLVTSEAAPLLAGLRYIIFALPLDLTSLPDEHLDKAKRNGIRTELGNVALRINDCVSTRFDEAESRGLVRELGPSHPPE
jgi:hypothetical protein